MPTINPNVCVSCGVCLEECPVGAIYEGESAYYIKNDECVGCGSCVGACPNNAIGGD